MWLFTTMSSAWSDFDPSDDGFITQAYDEYESELAATLSAPSPAHHATTITNADIIQQYRSKSSWVVAAEWLSSIISRPISAKVVRTDWSRLYDTYKKLNHPKYSSQKQTFLCRPYHVPSFSLPTDRSTSSIPIPIPAAPSSSTTASSSCAPASPTPAVTAQSACDTVLSALSGPDEPCQSSAHAKPAHTGTAIPSQCHLTAAKIQRRLMDRIKILSGSLEKQKEIIKKTQVENRELRKNQQKFNFQRKLKRRDETISKLTKQNNILNSKVNILNRKCKRLTERLRYSQSKVITHSDQVSALSSEIRDMSVEYDSLKSTMEEVMGDKQIETFREGHYTDEVRHVVYDLLSRGVSSRHVSDIIKIVMTNLGRSDVTRLPKATVVKTMAAEAGLLAKAYAANKISQSKSATLHTDGTTKSHEKFLDFVSTTDRGQVGLSLTMTTSGDTRTQIEATTSLFKELADILSATVDDSDKKRKADELLAKHQSLMTDRHIVNKCYADWLREWRQEALPTIQENWHVLDEQSQGKLLEVFDFYCGYHLGIQNNIDSTISDWEKVEASGRKIGRQNIMSYANNDSSTLCAIRSVCKAFGPDASESAGHPNQFSAFIQSSTHFVPFRGNRFNVPFVNASATYHHREQILNYISSIPQVEKNRLLQAIEADLSDPVIVAGIKSMSIMERIISTPLMAMLKSNIHILDTNEYYSTLCYKLENWAENTDELISGNSYLFAEFPSVKDKLWDSVFKDDITEEIRNLTKYCTSLSLITSLMTVERMAFDHLPGGKYHGASQAVRDTTITVPKHNNCAENLFSGLDRLKRKMPNSLCVTVEGILLYAMNKPRKYYVNLDDTTKLKLMAWIRKKARDVRKEDSQKKQDIKQFQHRQLVEKQLAKEERDKKKDTFAQGVEKNIYAKYGGPCRNEKDVRRMIKNCNKKDATEAVKTQIRYARNQNYASNIDKKLFAFSTRGREHPLSVLKRNLINIVASLYVDDDEDDLPLINFVDSDDDLPLAQMNTCSEDEIPLGEVLRDERRCQLAEEVREKLQKQREKLNTVEQ